MTKSYEYYSHMDELVKLADEWELEQQWRREIMETEIHVLPPMKASKLKPNGRLKLPRIVTHRKKEPLPF